MKLITTGIFFFFTTLLISQPLIWSDPIEVADGYGNLRPRLALANGDNPVIVWGGGTGSQPVYFSYRDGNGFSEPLAISPEGIDPYCASWTGPDIASAGDDVWVVFDAEVGNDFRVFVVKSTDGGATFSDTVNVGGYSGLSRFTAVAVANFANPVVTFMDHDPGYANPRYMVSTSLDGGLTWQTPVNGSTSITGDEVCDCCPPEIVTDGLNQMLMFRNNDSNLRDIWSTVSDDAGATFTKGTDIDDAGWMISACPSTGPDGFVRGDSVIMVWSTGGYGPPNKVMLTSVSKTTALGRSNQMIAPIENGKQDYPRIHGNEEVFGVVFQENINGSYDCLFSYSTDGSTNFEHTNIIINENTEGSQTNPDVIYSNGVFHFSWQDSYTGNVFYRSATLQEVGIEENGVSDFVIFPNPVQNRIKLSILREEDKIERIEIINNQGLSLSEIIPEKSNRHYEIDISDLPNGIYFIILQNQNSIVTRKFVKVN